MCGRALLLATGLVAVGFLPATAHAHHGGASLELFIPLNWYGGIGALGTHVLRQDGGPELLYDGVGFNAYGGVRLHQSFALEVGYLQSFHNPAAVDTYFGTRVDYLVVEALTLDARVYLGRKSIVEPYLQGGIGAYALTSQYFGLDSLGSGLQLGGGLDIYLSRAVALGARLLYRGILLGPPSSQVSDTFISTVTLMAAIEAHL